MFVFDSSSLTFSDSGMFRLIRLSITTSAVALFPKSVYSLRRPSKIASFLASMLRIVLPPFALGPFMVSMFTGEFPTLSHTKLLIVQFRSFSTSESMPCTLVLN